MYIAAVGLVCCAAALHSRKTLHTSLPALHISREKQRDREYRLRMRNERERGSHRSYNTNGKDSSSTRIKNRIYIQGQANCYPTQHESSIVILRDQLIIHEVRGDLCISQ